jgi:hypothetical protein
MRRPVFAHPVPLLLIAAAWLSGCAVDTEPAESIPQFDVTLGAVTTSCGGAAKNPLAEIKTLKLVVRGPNDAGELVNLGDTKTQAFSSGQSQITFKDVPAGSPREITLLGYKSGSTSPVWFARKSGLNIQKTKTIPLDLTLMALEGFTCLGQASVAPIPNVVFPTTTRMADGKVLIAGGFANAAKAADGTYTLEAPSDTAYVFDPGTGKFDTVKTKMIARRAAHSAIYLPQLNQVLLVGGATKMKVAPNLPPTWTATDGVNPPYEIYDVATGTFLAGANPQNAKKRVFPNLLRLSDDYVASVGGAPWPVADFAAYSQSDLFSKAEKDFVDIGGALPAVAVRGGSAVAEMGPTDEGTARYLIWGGNVQRSTDKAVGPVAEAFHESLALGTGAFDASFTFSGDFDSKTVLMFPTLTFLGTGTNAKNDWTDLAEGTRKVDRLLSVGGIRWDTGAQKWLAPGVNDAYLLTVLPSTPTTKARIAVKKVSGLKGGLYLHQASAVGANHVLFTGGFGNFAAAPETLAMQAFDIKASKFLADSAIPAVSDFVPRAGHSGLVLPNDCVLMFGGVDAFSSLNGAGAALSDIYCPKLLVP